MVVGWIASLKGNPQDTGVWISWYKNHIPAFVPFSFILRRAARVGDKSLGCFELAKPRYL